MGKKNMLFHFFTLVSRLVVLRCTTVHGWKYKEYNKNIMISDFPLGKHLFVSHYLCRYKKSFLFQWIPGQQHGVVFSWERHEVENRWMDSRTNFTCAGDSANIEGSSWLKIERARSCYKSEWVTEKHWHEV